MNLQNSHFWHWNVIKMKQCFNCKAPSSSFIQFWCFLFYNSKLMRWGILYIRWLLEVEGGVARLPEHRQHNTAAPSWGHPPPPAVVINTARGRHVPRHSSQSLHVSRTQVTHVPDMWQHHQCVEGLFVPRYVCIIPSQYHTTQQFQFYNRINPSAWQETINNGS